jgi:hypothetical protein
MRRMATRRHWSPGAELEPSLGIVADVWPSRLHWRRDHGDETLAEIGRSYNVSGWTISRLFPHRLIEG